MIRPVSISAVPYNIPHIVCKQNAESSSVPEMSLSEIRGHYEEEKIRLMKSGITILGCIGMLVAIPYSVSLFTKLAHQSHGKPKVPKNSVFFNAQFENLISNEKIPILEKCKSLNKTLKDLLQNQVDVKNADKEILKKTGAKPISRILLSGKPGTGKSFFGKVYAKTIGAEYMQVEYPDMNSKWAGEGVEKMDAIFRYIKETGQKNPDKNYVVVFNEIDAVFQPIEVYANNFYGGGHALTKMEQRATFLEYLEKVSEETPNVTIIGTTNLNPKNNGIDAAAISRFQHVYEVPMPDKSILYEALKMNISLLPGGENFIKSNEANLKKLAEKMEGKQCSFRDLENIIERSTGYYLRDAMQNKNTSYAYEYLTRAFDSHGITDGMTKN